MAHITDKPYIDNSNIILLLKSLADMLVVEYECFQNQICYRLKSSNFHKRFLDFSLILWYNNNILLNKEISIIMINIVDISKLKFTKFKPWKIYFRYEDDEYMILDSSEVGSSQLSLYKRNKLLSGNHTVEHIKTTITTLKPSDMIRTVSNNGNIVYSNIDRNYFVLKLLDLGFSEGYLEERHSRFNDKLNNIESEMRSLNIKLCELIKQRKELLDDKDNISYCASKRANAEVIKRRLAERVKGKQVGEWCEKYNCYYGETHEEYGGVLTDLNNLPVGTRFTACNGDWVDLIGYDSHGNKCVITDVNCIKLTKDNSSLFIEEM